MVIWVTGMSGAGKTTVCHALWEALDRRVPGLVILDGDAVRQSISFDLGYEEKDRVTQITRIQRLAKMLSDQGLVVLVAALYANSELLAWNRHNIDAYIEIYLRVSLEALQKRDAKSLYSGTRPDVVGVDIPWNEPVAPDLILDTDEFELPGVLAQQIIDLVPALAERVDRT